MKKVVYLVVNAQGDVRAAKRPRMGPDEVGIRVVLDFPSTWGTIVHQVEVDMPDPPTVDDAAVEA